MVVSFADEAVVVDEVENHCTEYEKDDIDSLIRQLREKDALIAEKDALLSQQPRASKSRVKFAPIEEDPGGSGGVTDEHETHGLEHELAGSVSAGSNATFADYLHAQKSMRFKSQKRMSKTLAMIEEDDGIHSSSIYSSVTSARTAEERRVISNMLGRRGAAAEWDNFDVEELDKDEEEDDHHHHHHKKNAAWYLPPVQRQRWCDDQILPHVNWGDLFFDLFYVGAAYNLGVLLQSCTKDAGEILRGFLYFFGTLGPLWTCWEAQTYYASRYLTNDYFHRLVEIIRHVCVGAAIYNITPISYFSNPSSDGVMVFTLTMLLELVMTMGLNVELYCKAKGDRSSIKNHTLDEFKFKNGATFALYLAAFILATVNFTHDHEASHRSLGPASEYQDAEAYSAESLWDFHDLPMTLTTAAYFLRFVSSSIRFHYREKKGDVRDWYVPTNIDYLIHRYGEFVMLMIGEGVMSVLVVKTVDMREYEIVVICGMLTMIFLNVLKTESDPADASKHALWRSPVSSMAYSLFTQILTIGLIGFGVTFKTFLYDIIDEDKYGDAYVKNVITGRVFSGFLTGVILSLELMNASHRGFNRSIGDLFHGEDKQKLNWPVVIIALLKVGIILFCVTLFAWTNEPEYLAASGLLIIVALIITRVLNHLFVHETELVQQTAEHALNLVKPKLSQVTELDNER